MAEDTATWIPKIKPLNGGKEVVTGIDLIYGMAIPCKAPGNCLEYLGGDIAETYIKPAAQRGWVVILETQLGRSDPATEVKRMIGRGYLKYDNVHVAIDPEFHLVQGHDDPGIPIGTVTAAQIGEVQRMLGAYVAAEKLRTRKILIVHQFGDAAVHDGVPFMIAHKKDLKEVAGVDLVIDADGLGTPDQIFGLAPVPGGLRMATRPAVLIIA